MLGGHEPLSNMVALAFPDLETPMCDLSSPLGRERFTAFLSSRPRVMEYLEGRVRARAAPPSSLGSLPPPDSPAPSDRDEAEGAPWARLVQEETEHASQAGDTMAEETSPCPKRYTKELESGRDRVYMRVVQSLQLVLHGQLDPTLGVTTSKPLHGLLAFAKVPIVGRPRQTPLARKMIVSAMPEVQGMAPASDLHPILASHATTESDKMLRSAITLSKA